MEEVATSLGYNRRTIFRHFLDLCRAISTKYRSVHSQIECTITINGRNWIRTSDLYDVNVAL